MWLLRNNWTWSRLWCFFTILSGQLSTWNKLSMVRLCSCGHKYRYQMYRCANSNGMWTFEQFAFKLLVDCVTYTWTITSVFRYYMKCSVQKTIFRHWVNLKIHGKMNHFDNELKTKLWEKFLILTNKFLFFKYTQCDSNSDRLEVSYQGCQELTDAMRYCTQPFVLETRSNALVMGKWI